jgi:hypothetical protein
VTRHVTRGGAYLRVADPGWHDPLDASYAAEHGGRWNPPGSFPMLYLCATVRVARANVFHRFERFPYGVLDLRPDRRPDLVEVHLAELRAVDVVTAAGCRSVGLPATYPFDGRRRIGWERTQPIGLRAFDAGEEAIAARSAALAEGERGEELARIIRRRKDRPRLTRRRPFDEWFG